MTSLTDRMNKLPKARRKKVEERAKALMALKRCPYVTCASLQEDALRSERHLRRQVYPIYRPISPVGAMDTA